MIRFRHTPPRPRVFTFSDLFGAACLLVIVVGPLLIIGGYQ